MNDHMMVNGIGAYRSYIIILLILAIVGIPVVSAASDDTIIGFRWNTSDSSPRLYQIDSTGAIIANKDATFWDNWNVTGNMKTVVVNATNSTVVLYGTNNRGDGLDLSGAYGDVMVEIPRFYTCSTYDYGKFSYWISPLPAPGFTVAPMFNQRGTGTDAGTPAAYYYVGRYDASLSGIKLQSATGKAPAVSMTIGTARTYAENKGAGWGITNIWTLSGLRQLFYTEMLTLNSQTAWTKSRGIVDTNSSKNSGADSIDTQISASSATGSGTGENGKTPVSYRGIENLWGNVYQFQDGFNAIQGTTNVISPTGLGTTGQKTTFKDVLDATDVQSVGALVLTNGWQKNLMNTSVARPLFLPSAVGGSDSTYLSDEYWYPPSKNPVRPNILLSGGSWGSRSTGVGRLDADGDVLLSFVTIGARLEYRRNTFPVAPAFPTILYGDSNFTLPIIVILIVLFLAGGGFALYRMMRKPSDDHPPAIETKKINRQQDIQLLHNQDLWNKSDVELRQRITTVEQRLSGLSHFRSPVQTFIAKAREQYRSGAYGAAKATLDTAETAIPSLKRYETQILQWKREGYTTAPLESMKTDNIDTINTAFRDFERDLLVLQQHNRSREKERLKNLAEIQKVTELKEKGRKLLSEVEQLGLVPERVRLKLNANDIPTIESAIEELESFINNSKPELTLTLDHTQLTAEKWHILGITLTNTGLVHVENIVLTLSNEFETKGIKPISVKAGESSRLDIRILPKNAGNILLDVTLTYRDHRGTEYRKEQEIPVDVVEKGTITTSVTPSSPVSQFTPKPLTPKQLPPDLSDRYTESEFIGKGGFARVFKAKRNDGKYVAVKIPISMDATTGRSFIAEMQNWTKLSHPNIVGLYDFNIMPMPYFEEELCDSALSELKKPLETEEAALILFNICEGLKFAHRQKIIHRDLKPQNILLKNGVPKISDWGLSRIISSSTTTTATSFTAYYAAPEQIGNKIKDERTDIWQLGVILYELVTGVLPFPGDSMVEVMAGIATKTPTLPSVITPSSHHVESIIMKCLEKKPDARYQSVLELQKDLALYLRVTYTELLKTSVSVQDYTRSAYYCGDLVMVNLFTGDMKSAYKYILDLVHYSKGDVKAEAQELSEQIKNRMELGVTEIPDELIQKAELIVHQMSVGFRNRG